MGAGLIGASMIAAQRDALGLDRGLVISDGDPDHLRIVLERFPGASAAPSIAAFADCDVVIVATPADAVAETIQRLAQVCAPSALLIDTASVKLRIVRELEAMGGPPSNYVPGHPLAGANAIGPAKASADIIRGKRFVLTPHGQGGEDLTPDASAYVAAIGARPVVVDPAVHDQVLATTSHLSNLTSFALWENFLALREAYGEIADRLAVPSLESMTAYAEGNPEMWLDILEGNAGPIAAALDAGIARLTAYRDAIAQGDWAALKTRLEELMRSRAEFEL